MTAFPLAAQPEVDLSQGMSEVDRSGTHLLNEVS